MKIEKLNDSKRKKTAIWIVAVVAILSVGIFAASKAKYRKTISINVAKGIINYKVPDVNTVALYLETDSGKYTEANDIPTSGYTLNIAPDKTRCEVNKIKDEEITITYNNGKVSVDGISKRGTKCYLYFDKISDADAPVIGVHEARNIEKTSMDLYVEATDDTGIAGYYFKLSSSSDWSNAKCTGQTSCTYSVTGLAVNTSYTYDVKVCDVGGNCPTTTITQKTKANGIETGEIISEGTATDDSMFAGIEGNGIYTWTKGDYSGGSHPIKYFRGNVSNNWVVFGKDGSNYIWWRIIRNNSNGSLRMIYAGTSSNKTSAPATTGNGTHVSGEAFNSNSKNNMYVGFKYTSGQVHGTGTNSTMLGTLNSWYNSTLAKSTELVLEYIYRHKSMDNVI